MLRLAERMMRKFWANLSDSTENIWSPVPLKGAENVLAMIINAEDEEGHPPGTSIVIATTVWVPASPRRVFDFLNNEGTRNQVSFDAIAFSIIDYRLHLDQANTQERKKNTKKNDFFHIWFPV